MMATGIANKNYSNVLKIKIIITIDYCCVLLLFARHIHQIIDISHRFYFLKVSISNYISDFGNTSAQIENEFAACYITQHGQNSVSLNC